MDNGLGGMTVLPTSPEDGRALAVSADGSVVLGGSSPNTGAGRAIVYRLNSGTGEYVGTVLPNGIDPTTSEPYGMFVDSMHMNDSGTIIVGNSFEYDATLEFPLEWLTRWTWNSTTQQWDRALLATGTAGLSTWWNDPFCPIPPSLIPTGMTADSTRIVGILVYPTCGSFIRGGFIYDGSSGQLMDLYDRLQSIGTSGLSDFSPREPQNSPPRLGWPVGISADGSKMVGYGGPQSGYGPAWAFDANNSNCVPVFVARNPVDTIFSRCASVILNAGAGVSGPISYVWTRNGQPITDGLTAHGSTIEGASTSRLLINNPHPADAGAYACINRLGKAPRPRLRARHHPLPNLWWPHAGPRGRLRPRGGRSASPASTIAPARMSLIPALPCGMDRRSRAAKRAGAGMRGASSWFEVGRLPCGGFVMYTSERPTTSRAPPLTRPDLLQDLRHDSIDRSARAPHRMHHG